MAAPNASIDLTNPAVRRMLGDQDRPAAGSRKSLVQVAGDAEHGVTSAINLDIGKIEVLVLAKKGDVPLLTVDVYQVEGEPIKIHILCPRCHHHATIRQDQKAIDFDARAPNRQQNEIRALGISPEMQRIAAYGDLSVEEFECPWELDGSLKVSSFSGNLCRFRAAIDHNLLKIAG